MSCLTAVRPRFTAASDAALLFNALSYAGAEALVGKNLVFINTTHDGLSGGHLELIAQRKSSWKFPRCLRAAAPLTLPPAAAYLVP